MENRMNTGAGFDGELREEKRNPGLESVEPAAADYPETKPVDYAAAVGSFGQGSGAGEVTGVKGKREPLTDVEAALFGDAEPEFAEVASEPDPANTVAGDDIEPEEFRIRREAKELRYRRQSALATVAQSQQGRGIPTYALAQQAEELMLWLDGEITADELWVQYAAD